MTIITTAIPSDDTIGTLYSIIPEYIESLDNYSSEMTIKNSLIKVFVNGFWTGFIKKMYIKVAV
jgi:hypothetical protein